MENSPYAFLNTKKMYEIFDGDTKFGLYKCKDGTCVEISMPYLSAQDICDISTMFGVNQKPSGLSRWQYFEPLLDSCIRNNKVVELLNYLFSYSQFSEKLKYCPEDIKEEAYHGIVNTIIQTTGEKLRLSGNEFVFANNLIDVKPICNKVMVQSPKIKVIDRNYIKSVSERAMKDIEENNFDSAITKSRTLLEEVFCYVIERRKQKPSDDGNISKLFNQVKSLYNMHIDPDTDKRVKSLISGLHSIVSAIAEMRNHGSDSHGVGAKRMEIEEYHARLCVNAATTMSDFILSVENKINNHKST